MLMNWSDDYLVGITEIDEQHKAFFEATHRLYDHILNCEGEKAIEESVTFLRDYANNHFRIEEAFMQKHGFPRLEEHRKLHAEFFDMLEALVQDLALFGPSQHLADHALEVSQDWLIRHIIDEDSQYAAHVRQQAQ